MMLNMERDDDLAEADVTEEEFDEMFARGEPVEVVPSPVLVEWTDLYVVSTDPRWVGGG